MRVRRPIRQRPITNFGGPRPRPDVQQGVQVINGVKQLVDIPPRDPNMFSSTPPRPGMFPSTIVNPIRQPGMQSQANTFNSTPPRPPQLFVDGIPATPNIGAMGNPISQPGGAVDPIRQPGGMGPRPNNLGPMQGVGDPRLGAAIIPGNQAQMMMRGPTQAAPVQPVPAMKKGGVVRGGRAEIKGLRPAKLT